MNTEQLKQAALKATPGPVAFRTRYRLAIVRAAAEIGRAMP